MDRKRPRGARYAGFCLVLIGCLTTFALTATDGTLRIGGSTTLLPLAESWVEDYAVRHPEVRPELSGGGTGAGFAGLAEGRLDVALASRPARDAELMRVAEGGRTLERIEVARDALAVVVHRDNPLQTLDHDRLARVFSGEITRWDELGGPPRPIVVVLRNPDSHIGEFFRRQILEARGFATGGIVTRDRDETLARVAAEPGAIGFAGLGDALRADRRASVRPLRIRAPSDESSFAISRPLFLYVARPRSPEVARFVDFVLGETGQELVVLDGFLPRGSYREHGRLGCDLR